MTDHEIAIAVVDALDDRCPPTELGEILGPSLHYSPMYVAVQIAGLTIWDSEDENGAHDDGDTVETALEYAEARIAEIAATLACFGPAEVREYLGRQR